jgi:photosystem II stability/assembly factor-like uncharacterized protein
MAYARTIGVTVFLLLFSAACRQNEWRRIQPNPGGPTRRIHWWSRRAYLQDVWSPDGQNIWVVGNEGTLLYSADGGKTWSPRGGGARNLLSIRGDGTGQRLWAVGDRGTILHSANGGTMWSEQVSQTQALLYSVHVSTDGQRLCAFGVPGYLRDNELNVILQSTDGGKTWTKRQAPSRDRVIQVGADCQHLWAPGRDGVLLHSADGGNTWTENTTLTQVRSAHVGYDGQDLWVIAADPHSPQHQQSAALLHSSDAGKTWEVQTSGATIASLRALRAHSDGRQVWAISEGREGSTILSSGDAGKSWTPQTSGAIFLSIYAHSDGRRLWAVGGGGVIIHSEDGGATWSPQTDPNEIRIRSIQPQSDGRGLWAVGSEGLILHSDDSGLTWSQKASLNGIYLTAIHVNADGQRLWAIGRQGMMLRAPGTILRSMDGGKTWKQTPSVTEADLRAIHGHVDGRRLWIVGDDGTILYSADSGERWQKQEIGSWSRRYDLSSMYLHPDGQRLWAVGGKRSVALYGEVGVIIHSRNGGKDWEPQRIAGKPMLEGSILKSIYGNSDGRRLWVVGEHGTILYSSDGGENWSQQTSPARSNLYYVSGQGSGVQLWVVGARGTILYSADGGTIWSQLRSPNEGVLTSIHVTTEGDRLWALGEGMLIGAPGDPYPRPKEVRLREIAGKGAVLDVRLLSIQEGENDPVFRLTGDSKGLWNQRPSSDVRLVRTSRAGSDVWSLEFSPEDTMNVHRGESMHLKLDIETDRSGEIFREAFDLGNFRYHPWRPSAVHYGIAGLLLIPVSLTVLLFAAPLYVLTIFRRSRLPMLLDQFPVAGWALLVRFAAKIATLEFFLEHQRVLDAWVRQHSARAMELHEGDADRLGSPVYVELPIRSVSERYERPRARDFAPFFAGRPAVVQIIGPGGSGKTSLALQIGRWALATRQQQKLLPTTAIPVLVDEETTDLPAVVLRKLRARFDSELTADFMNALLRKKRVLVIFDRVSELSEATRQTIQTIHGSHPGINTLIITTRHEVPFEFGRPVTLWPEYLGTENLLHFALWLLPNLSRSGQPSHSYFSEMSHQLDLGTRFEKIMQFRSRSAVPPVTPLLVRLYLEQAVEIINQGRSLDEMPPSIPELFVAYLKAVHRSARPSGLSNERMLTGAQEIAAEMLKERYVPKEVPKTRLEQRLSKFDWFSNECDPIQALLSSGVLTARDVGAESLVRFTLDPVAEFFAAKAYGDHCGSDKSRWNELKENVRKHSGAEGFLNALELTSATYGCVLGWPEWHDLE